MTCNVWSKRAGGRTGGREGGALFIISALSSCRSRSSAKWRGRQTEQEEVPATVDIRNANKRPRGKGGRAISSSIKETQSNAITTMSTEKREEVDLGRA